MALPTELKKHLEYLKMLVSLRVDEYTPDEEDIEIPFGDIEYELNQAARYVMRLVPRNVSFHGIKSYDLAVIEEIAGQNGGVIPLPSDYLRFTSVKIADWKLPVTQYMRDTSKAYKQQQFPMRRGTNEKPVAFLIPYTKKYEAGVAPEILAIKEDETSFPKAGDTLQNGGNDVATVLSIEDPDYIYVDAIDGSGYVAAVGDQLTLPGEEGYTLTVKYKQGDEYYRISKVRQALEVYPYGSGQVEELQYIPYMKAYEIPEEFEDVLVWRAASSILMIMGRSNNSKMALEQMAIAQQAINTGLYGEERYRDE